MTAIDRQATTPQPPHVPCPTHAHRQAVHTNKTVIHWAFIVDTQSHRTRCPNRRGFIARYSVGTRAGGTQGPGRRHRHAAARCARNSSPSATRVPATGTHTQLLAQSSFPPTLPSTLLHGEGPVHPPIQPLPHCWLRSGALHFPATGALPDVCRAPLSLMHVPLPLRHWQLCDNILNSVPPEH